MVFVITIHWIAIYPVDSADVQLLDKWGQDSEQNELPKETVTSQSLSIFKSKLFQVIFFLLAVYISFISSFSFYYYLVFFSVLELA